MFYLCRTHPTFTLLCISCKTRSPRMKTQVCSRTLSNKNLILNTFATPTRHPTLTCFQHHDPPPSCLLPLDSKQSRERKVVSSLVSCLSGVLCGALCSAQLQFSSAYGVGRFAVFPACVSGFLVMYYFNLWPLMSA